MHATAQSPDTDGVLSFVFSSGTAQSDYLRDSHLVTVSRASDDGSLSISAVELPQSSGEPLQAIGCPAVIVNDSVTGELLFVRIGGYNSFSRMLGSPRVLPLTESALAQDSPWLLGQQVSSDASGWSEMSWPIVSAAAVPLPQTDYPGKFAVIFGTSYSPSPSSTVVSDTLTVFTVADTNHFTWETVDLVGRSSGYPVPVGRHSAAYLPLTYAGLPETAPAALRRGLIVHGGAVRPSPRVSDFLTPGETLCDTWLIDPVTGDAFQLHPGVAGNDAEEVPCYWQHTITLAAIGASSFTLRVQEGLTDSNFLQDEAHFLEVPFSTVEVATATAATVPVWTTAVDEAVRSRQGTRSFTGQVSVCAVEAAASSGAFPAEATLTCLAPLGGTLEPTYGGSNRSELFSSYLLASAPLSSTEHAFLETQDLAAHPNAAGVEMWAPSTLPTIGARTRFYRYGAARPTTTGDLWAFDVTTLEWTLLQEEADIVAASGPTARTRLCMVSHGGALFFIGGWSQAENFLDTVYRFDELAGTWELWATLPYPLGMSTCALLPWRDEVAVSGGLNDTGYSSDLLIVSLAEKDAVRHFAAPSGSSPFWPPAFAAGFAFFAAPTSVLSLPAPLLSTPASANAAAGALTEADRAMAADYLPSRVFFHGGVHLSGTNDETFYLNLAFLDDDNVPASGLGADDYASLPGSVSAPFGDATSAASPVLAYITPVAVLDRLHLFSGRQAAVYAALQTPAESIHTLDISFSALEADPPVLSWSTLPLEAASSVAFRWDAYAAASVPLYTPTEGSSCTDPTYSLAQFLKFEDSDCAAAVFAAPSTVLVGGITTDAWLSDFNTVAYVPPPVWGPSFSLQLLIFIPAAVATLVSVLALVMVAARRRQPHIRALSPLLLGAALLGLSLVSAWPIVELVAIGPVSCAIRLLMLPVGSVLFATALAAKAARIAAIFSVANVASRAQTRRMASKASKAASSLATYVAQIAAAIFCCVVLVGIAFATAQSHSTVGGYVPFALPPTAYGSADAAIAAYLVQPTSVVSRGEAPDHAAFSALSSGVYAAGTEALFATPTEYLLNHCSASWTFLLGTPLSSKFPLLLCLLVQVLALFFALLSSFQMRGVAATHNDASLIRFAVYNLLITCFVLYGLMLSGQPVIAQAFAPLAAAIGSFLAAVSFSLQYLLLIASSPAISAQASVAQPSTGFAFETLTVMHPSGPAESCGRCFPAV
jgi:hypothetical protein